MSGGHFDYTQYQLNHIVESIEQLIRTNDMPNEYGDIRGYSPETIERFKMAIGFLQTAQIYAQRIDWLISGDDGEETFHERLIDELNKLDDSVG